MSQETINLGRDGDGNGNRAAVVSSMPELVPVVFAMASLLFNNQLPGEVIPLLLGLAVNGPSSQLNAAVAVAGQILQLNAAYDKYTAVIYTSLTLYAMIQVPIFASIFSAQRGMGCGQIWWSPIIVSGLASASIIVTLFVIFILQFKILSRRGQLRGQLRGHVGEGGLSILSTTTTNGGIIAAEAEEYADINWVVPRGGFLVILLVFSLCFLLSYTPLLCPHVP